MFLYTLSVFFTILKKRENPNIADIITKVFAIPVAATAKVA